MLYQRIGYSDNEYTNLCVYSEDSHEKIREHFEWGKRKDGVGKLPDKTVYVKLKGITDDYLLALIIYTKENYAEEIHKVFVDEVKYRNQESKIRHLECAVLNSLGMGSTHVA